MNKSDLQYFKKLLIDQLNDLLKKGNTTADNLKESATADLIDPWDRATYDTNQNIVFRIRDRESRLINKIKAALNRIETGEFGICENCGSEISRKRLEARPIASLCIKCKIEQEAIEKIVNL